MESISSVISEDLIAPFYTSFEEEYRSIKEGAAWYREGGGILQLAGAESLDFLQRLSTNDMTPLAAGECVTTVLTTEKGRIVDFCTVLPSQEHLVMVTSRGMAGKVKSWLEKFIIMEDITVTDLSVSHTTASLMGPEVENLLSSHLPNGLDSTGQLPCHFRWNEEGFFLTRDKRSSVPCYRLFASCSGLEALLAKGEGFPEDVLRPVGTRAYDSFRIENGLPIMGRDIDEQVNPLEAALRGYVSFTKGCYIGQEVIARIDTYQKLRKELRGLIIDAPEGGTLSPGTLWVSTEQIGVTTSHSWSIALQRHIALGFVKAGTESSRIDYRTEPEAVPFAAALSKFPMC